MPENDNNWVHRNYVCLLVKQTDWMASLHNIFCHFFHFPPDFHQRNGDTGSCACYNVYGADNLSIISNLCKKKSTRPKLALYLPMVENMAANIFWRLAMIFVSKTFVGSVFQLRNIQHSSKSRNIGALGEEGMIVAWWCSAPARPTFQSSVAVYNQACWSRITTGFFWIVYFYNGQ